MDGATQIQVRGSQTFSGAAARVTPPTPPPAPPREPEPEPVEYTVLAVVTPEAQQTLFNIGGQLEVELAIFPPLSDQHMIDVELDGEYRSIAARDIRFVVPEVWRGEHTMQAIVVDFERNEIKRSLPTTFYVRQNSVLIPN